MVMKMFNRQKMEIGARIARLIHAVVKFNLLKVVVAVVGVGVIVIVIVIVIIIVIATTIIIIIVILIA